MIECMILFSYTDNYGILLGNRRGSSFPGPGFQLVSCFHRYWASSSKSTVRPRMESCFQDRACSVSSLMTIRICDAFLSLPLPHTTIFSPSSHPAHFPPMFCHLNLNLCHAAPSNLSHANQNPSGQPKLRLSSGVPWPLGESI